MPKTRRESVDVTALLRNILDNYPSGSAVIREFLQNTDDSGATTQSFILDTRTFPSDALLDPVLASCQGPAIIARNDGYFRDKDWSAITQIHNSSKKRDETSTGKYGLGFRSSYHVTDTPQILSGDELLILDPHQRIKNHPGGVQLSTKGADRQAYRGHFDAFKAVLSSTDTRYEGTAIRLPLRLAASQSRIKSTATDVNAARQMLQDFITKDLGECMLFLKHITNINIIEIAPDGSPTILGRSWIDNADIVGPLRSRNRGRKVETSHYGLTVNVELAGYVSVYRWSITQFVENYGVAQKHLEKRLCRSALASNMAAEKLLPHVALAFPLTKRNASASPFVGRLFTLLPLPIFTGFPLHINAVLAHTSSRQNLRSAADAVRGSPEELLVEWNKVIFSELVPKAWAAMFRHFTALPDDIDIFAAWPPFPTSDEGDRMYWKALPIRLLEEAGLMPIWPVQQLDRTRPAYHKIRDILVASVLSTPSDLISNLKTCGVPIATPPDSVHELILRSASYYSQLLTPATVHPFLKATLDAAAIKAITDYLTTGANLILLYDIPIFLNCRGGYTSLRLGRSHTFATDIEASLFEGADPELLMLDDISPATHAILGEAHVENIHIVRPIEVARYLSQNFSRPQSQEATISVHANAGGTAWLVQFWNWVNTWAQASVLFGHTFSAVLQPLYLIPLDAPADRQLLRRLEYGVVDGQALDFGVRDVLRAFEVPVLHPDVLIAGRSHHVPTTQVDVPFILENIPNHLSFDHLDEDTRPILHRFLTDQLTIFNRSGHKLSSAHKTILRKLPIFPLLSAGLRSKSSETSVPTFTTASQSALFVDDSVQVIPSISGRFFLDGREGAILSQALEQNAEGEVGVLKLVLEPASWAQQESVEHLPDVLVDRLVRRLNDFDNVDRARIVNLPIVVVGASRSRVKPSTVVDPESKVAGLFDAEDGVLPYDRFAEDGPGTLLQQLRSFGMLRSKLDEPTIVHVITKLGDTSKPVAPREKKALLILPLLDEYASLVPTFPGLHTTLLNQRWLPAGEKICCPSECWDSRQSDAELCDFVLRRVPVTIHSSKLREALGWEIVPSSTIQAQFAAVVRKKPLYPLDFQSHPSKRIISIPTELSKRYHGYKLSKDTLAIIVKALGDFPWVPVSLDCCRTPSQTMLSRIEVGSRFQPIYPPLLEHTGLGAMLKAMGVSNRPSPSALVTELLLIATALTRASADGRPKGDLVNDSLAILHEISHRASEFDLSQLLILTEAEEMKLFGTIVFNDRGFDGGELPAGSFFAHPSVSRSVALDLGLRQLSDEEFDQDDDDMKTFRMVEELSTRVRNTLKGYDLEYASNEWVANADDARATTVRFILQERRFTGSKLLSPDMKQFQEVPSLVIYNDGVFTEKDFNGIGSVGLGGKGETPGTIGRFGLGAFSFYHFTDLLMLVSGCSVLFLDPSQSYLPRKKGLRQTGIKMSLSSCRLRYPDQLKPLDGMFGFNSSTEVYQGTLFRLPLRTADQAAGSKLSIKSFTVSALSNILHRYFRASTQSMFFSNLKSISALRQGPKGAMSTMWSVEGSRHPHNHEEDAMRVELNIRDEDNAKWTEHWLVCMSSHKEEDFPQLLRPLFQQHCLPIPVTGIALNTSSEGNPSRDLNFRLFATLPLPVSISLPAHIHATWILSEDRRSLRYDLQDGSGRRPLDAKYNEFILQSLIPPLYLRALGIICSHNPREMGRCWPRYPTDPVSQEVSSALYSQLKDTKERVLRTSLDEAIAPKDAFIHVYGPAAVGKVLAALNLQGFVCRLPFNSTLVKDWDSFQIDNAKDVATLLRDHSGDVSSFYETETAKATDIDSILTYLLQAEVDLRGVPLLQLGSGKVTPFKLASEPKVFCTSQSDVASIFGREKIIGLALMISPKIAETLRSRNLNVRSLDVEGMRELLRHSAAQVVPREDTNIPVESRPWYEKVLEFLTSPTSPVQLEDLADLPLIPAFHHEVAISLHRARQPDVWWQSYNDQEITAVIRQCNIPIVQFPGNWLMQKDEASLARVLDVFQSSGVYLLLAQHKVVTSPEWTDFAEWMKRRLSSPEIQRLDQIQLQTLGYLPLFSGQQGDTPVPFASASNISMLPAQVVASDVARYLPRYIIFSSFSYSLQVTLEHLMSNQSLSIQAVISQLKLPSVLPQSEEAALKSIINIVCQHFHGQGVYGSPLVPDENWNLRVPFTLYDGNVPVFRQSFNNRPEVFVHPNFRDVLDRLVPLGVHRMVTPLDIVSCARAIDQDTRKGTMDTRGRAEFLWHFLNEEFNDARRLDFNTISNLRFIPSHRQRHPADPEFSHYGRVLPDVLSMNQLCLTQYAQTIWTQRATFEEAPSAITMAISPELGVPTVQELVEHLVILTTIVARDLKHSGNRLLLSDIRHTYLAIQNKAAAAKPLLLRHKHQRIWLNVNDPLTTEWEWRSAAELVFDLRYDNGRFYDVKAFLDPYRDILLAAGAEQYRYATLAPTEKASHAEKLLAGWQDLRNERELFDIQFTVDGESIKAHRGILAAVVPYFKAAFTAGFRESQSLADAISLEDELVAYPVTPGICAFAVRSAVDFVYTGGFSAPSSETTEESAVALEDLLDLLELATIWLLEDLKTLVVETMVSLHLVRAETCDDILERVQNWDVPQLVKICQENKANNKWI